MVDANQTYYETVKLIQEKLVVNSLKSILRQLEMSVTGRKAYLQSRLIDYMSTGIRRDDTGRVDNVYRLVIAELNPTSHSTPSAPPTSTSYSSQINHAARSSMPLHQMSTNSYDSYSSMQAFQPAFSVPKITFQETPFYSLERILGDPLYIPITLKDMPRKNSIRFTLTEADIEGIKNSKFSVLLLCTSISDPKLFQTSVLQYPQQPEIRINQALMQVNVRGLKGKPGTARAPDITKMLSLQTQLPNKVDVTVQDVTQPFGMFAYLVRPVKLEALVEAIKERSHISKESTIQKVISENNDDDVQAISTVLSLKCPLSYCRISLPVRSVYCDHMECFDASSFLMLQQQATTWTCPICNKALHYSALAVDEYLQEILVKTASYDIDEIEIGEDGQWKMPRDAQLINSGDDDYDSDEQPTKAETKPRNSFMADDPIVISLSDSDDDDDVNEVTQPSLLLPPVLTTSSAVPASPATTAGPTFTASPTVPHLASPSTNPSAANYSQLPAIGSFPILNTGGSHNDSILMNSLQNSTNGIANGNRTSNGSSFRQSGLNGPRPFPTNFEDIYDTPLPPSSLLQRSGPSQSRGTPVISGAPTSNERSLLPPIHQNLAVSRPSHIEDGDIFSSLPEWETSMFSRSRKSDNPQNNSTNNNSNSSSTNNNGSNTNNSTPNSNSNPLHSGASSPATPHSSSHLTPPMSLDPRFQQQYRNAPSSAVSGTFSRQANNLPFYNGGSAQSQTNQSQSQQQQQASTKVGSLSWQLPSFSSLIPGNGEPPETSVLTSTNGTSNGSTVAAQTIISSHEIQPLMPSKEESPDRLEPADISATTTSRATSDSIAIVAESSTGMKRGMSEVIDLTLSDDEDADNPPSKR